MVNKLGLIMGIIGLILSIIWGKMYYSAKRETEQLIKKGEITLVELEKSAKRKADSISAGIKRRDSIISNLLIAQKEDKKSLDKAFKISNSLSSDLRRAKANRDTVQYYAKCDSLVEQVVVLQAENSSYQTKVDLLNSNYNSQLLTKDSLLKVKEELYSKLRTSYDGSILKNNELKDKNKNLEFKLERQKKTTKLVAIIGAAVAGSIYLSTR